MSDGTGLQPGHPCRAHVEGRDFVVSGKSDLGVKIIQDFQHVEVDDRSGIPIVNLLVDGRGASAARADRRVIRRVDRVAPDRYAIGPLQASGTLDVLLVAILTSPELTPEVRAHAACERVL